MEFSIYKPTSILVMVFTVPKIRGLSLMERMIFMVVYGQGVHKRNGKKRKVEVVDSW